MLNIKSSNIIKYTAKYRQWQMTLGGNKH